ncbi:MAG: hypothetical protein P1P90_04635 [Patescibacteria group bacterium]|nr:hypothetical protein [Patescibacteria group bacterium]
MTKETSKKRVIRKRTKAGNSPSPSAKSKCGPCGHSHCDDKCRVRYIGPTTHVRDHHILHAARGISHIWPAVIIAGLAIVLTGAISYQTVNAQNKQIDRELSQNSTEQILNKLDSLETRIDVMERDIEGLFRAQGNDNNVTPDSVFPPLN